jgi:Ran GTPase-activating protein (RanGAP) involved in mRNA processing and transport
MQGEPDPLLQRVPNYVSAQLLLGDAELTPFTVRDKYIRTVDLGCNTIGEEALHALELLLALGDVRELKLGGNSIGDLALARIVKAMPRNSGGLELMSLEANCLTDAGVAELCSFLETDGCRSLTSLNVANNNLSAAAAHALQRDSLCSRSRRECARHGG